MARYDQCMSTTFTLIVASIVLAVFVAAGWFVWHEIRRHHHELAVKKRLLEQARPILQAASCAACGGTLSTWDGGLLPLPVGQHVAPANFSKQLVAEYEARRECLGCGHQFILWLWSDGANWGFQVVMNEE